MKSRKIIMTCFATFTVFLISIIVLNTKKNIYDVNMPIRNYDFSDYKVEDEYINHLKKDIYPIKIRSFIDNDFIPTNLLSEDDTGKEMIELMRFIGYKMLFNSMFDKSRTNFDDCPVTEKFKEKFNTNLLKHFNLIISEDCRSNCLLNLEENNIKVEVYGNFENTEPTYWKTYHFHYTLDNEGNVDDVIFDNTIE